MIPHDLEQGKVARLAHLRPHAGRIRGNYDDVNRLCTEIADKYGWAIVNVNLRPYYTEGAKTYGFEIAEQLGWRFPQHIVVADRRRHDPAEDLPRLPGAASARARRGRPAEDLLRAGGRLHPVVRAIHKGIDIPSRRSPNTIAK